MSKSLFLVFSFILWNAVYAISQDTLLYETFQTATLGQFASTDIDGLPLGPDFVGLEGGYQALGISGPNDQRAVAVSSFDGGGTADNWLISPAIELTKPSTKLKWRGTSLSGDPLLGEDYRVMLSRTTGIVSDFTDILAIITNESFTGTDREFDLSGYTGQTVHIAFQQNGTNKYALTLDDILVIEPGSDDEAKIITIEGERYQSIGEHSLVCEVFNSGSNTITDLEIETTYNGTVDIELISDLNIAPQTSARVPIAVLFEFEPQKYLIDAKVVSVNGLDIESEVASTVLYMIDTNAPAIDFLVEEATSATCGWCPAGIVAKDELEQDFPFSYVGISVHSDDPMEVPAYDLGLINQDGYIGVPSATVNRKAFMPMEEVQSYFETNNRIKAPATLDIIYDYNSATRELSATLSAFAHTELNADDHRFGFVLLEDNVVGAGPDYDQNNFYSAEASNLPLIGVDGVNWQDLPAIVPAEDMIYNDVARDLIGGFDGIQNSITTASVGMTTLYELEYALPSTIDQNQVNLVVFILDITTGEIINVFKEKMQFVSSTTTATETPKMTLFPNPAQNKFSIKYAGNLSAIFNVELFQFDGKLIKTYKDLKVLDNQAFELDASHLPPGNYLVKISSDSAPTVYKKLMLLK